MHYVPFMFLLLVKATHPSQVTLKSFFPWTPLPTFSLEVKGQQIKKCLLICPATGEGKRNSDCVNCVSCSKQWKRCEFIPKLTLVDKLKRSLQASAHSKVLFRKRGEEKKINIYQWNYSCWFAQCAILLTRWHLVRCLIPHSSKPSWLSSHFPCPLERVLIHHIAQIEN